MSAIQLSFKMRTSSGVKTVHLVGSWDNYTGQLPLASASSSSSSSSSSKKSSSSSSSSSSWKGTFRFHAHGPLQPGQRYWYYYILDGHHVSHDPAEAHVVEPTTGRKLNILDVAADATASATSSSSSSRSRSSKHSSSSTSSSTSRHNLSVDIPKGRPLSISQIKSPKPISPGAANFILAHGDPTATATSYGYDNYSYDDLADQFAQTSLHADADAYYTSTSSSSSSSISSSPSSFSSSSSLASSMSDYSSSSSSSGASSPTSTSSRHSRRHAPTCTCERYGITRQGNRIRLDCGGSRCAGLSSFSPSSSSSGFSSSDECCEEEEEEEVVVMKKSSSSSRHSSSREKADGRKTKDAKTKERDVKTKESRHHHRQRA